MKCFKCNVDAAMCCDFVHVVDICRHCYNKAIRQYRITRLSGENRYRRLGKTLIMTLPLLTPTQKVENIPLKSITHLQLKKKIDSKVNK